MIHDYLPINKEDMKKRGWEQCDFVYVSGDAYVDHPSFGTAIISRLLEAHGYKVGIIAQPDWKDNKSIQILGRPRLGFLVSAGNMDSMVNHYSVSKKRRKEDSYTPGGVMGKRPDYAVVVYCNLIRSVYKDVPIIAGGIEASLRRLAHYDYWSNKMKRSILLDAQADIISYGMGEHSIVELADALDSGLDIKDITFIDGTVYKTKNLESVYDYKLLPDYTELLEDKKRYAESFFVQYSNTDPFSGKRLVEPYEGKVYVVQNPPAKPLTQEEMDDVYDLPYMRSYHPSYEAAGGVPAIREIKFRHISNSKHPITTPEDLEGIKIRTMENPIHMDSFREWGASPTPMAFSELFTGLQQGTIDAQENPLQIISSSRFYEVQDYLTISGHFFATGSLLFNKDFVDKLPDDLREILYDCARESTIYGRELVAEMEADYLEELKANGMEVNVLTDEQKQLFIDKSKQVYEKYEDVLGKDLIEKARKYNGEQ